MENAERKNRFAALLIMSIIAVGCLVAIPLLFSGCSNDIKKPVNVEQEEIEEPVELNIFCVGDIMVHKSQISSQYDANTDKYDYTNNYKYIKEYMSKADLALFNLETTFAGKPYSGYPAFSAPDELADAIKDAGFDVAITSNNHMMDKGKAGMERTLNVLREKGFYTAGSRLTNEEERFALVDVKGVKVAVVPYTYETPSNGGNTAINGNVISSKDAELINSFSYETIGNDLLEIQNTCEAARQAGAEIVVLYYHWGEEYQLSANKWQKYIAEQSVNNMDIDIIFASHPHVLQEMEYLQNENTGKKVPVFYSMGNFISNQRRETLPDLQNNKHTEEGIIAKVNLKYMKSQGEIIEINMSALPTWVEKYKVGGKSIYEIIPLDENLNENETLNALGHLLKAQTALEDANGILKAN